MAKSANQECKVFATVGEKIGDETPVSIKFTFDTEEELNAIIPVFAETIPVYKLTNNSLTIENYAAPQEPRVTCSDSGSVKIAFDNCHVPLSMFTFYKKMFPNIHFDWNNLYFTPNKELSVPYSPPNQEEIDNLKTSIMMERLCAIDNLKKDIIKRYESYEPEQATPDYLDKLKIDLKAKKDAVNLLAGELVLKGELDAAQKEKVDECITKTSTRDFPGCLKDAKITDQTLLKQMKEYIFTKGIASNLLEISNRNKLTEQKIEIINSLLDALGNREVNTIEHQTQNIQPATPDTSDVHESTADTPSYINPASGRSVYTMSELSAAGFAPACDIVGFNDDVQFLGSASAGAGE